MPVKNLVDVNMEPRKDLINLPEVQAQRPPTVGYWRDAMFYKYNGTPCFQWYVQTRSGWEPYGPIMVITGRSLTDVRYKIARRC